MQTFLPYPDFRQSAECLDPVRRWKQVVETRQLINTISRQSGGWSNHPATVMWSNYLDALKLYYREMLSVVLEKRTHYTVKYRLSDYPIYGNVVYPWWLGLPKLHASHRSNLLRKDAQYYGQFGWTEPNDLPYYWPGASNDLFRLE